MQRNTKGLKSNFEDLKLMLTILNIPTVALQLRSSYFCGDSTLLKGNFPAGEAALLINKREVHTELTIDTHVRAVAAAITLGKTFTICSIILTFGEKISKLSLENLMRLT